MSDGRAGGGEEQPRSGDEPAAGSFARVRVLILGRGRLGASLAEAFERGGVQVSNLPAPRELQEPEASREPNAPSAAMTAVALPAADLVLLAVPDGEIARTAERLAERLRNRRTAVAHLSGALGLGELAALAARGHPVGSFHPFQPFPAVRPPSAFEGIAVGIDADDQATRELLQALAAAIGAHGRPVAAEDRALYHAAAMVASAYVVVLAAQAQELLRAVGWGEEDALQALLPLMEGTLENLAVNGAAPALSGPLRRGDAKPISEHLQAFARLPEEVRGEIVEVYRALGIAGAQLAQEVGVDRDASQAIVALLREHAAREGATAVPARGGDRVREHSGG